MAFESVILFDSKKSENNFYPFSVLHPTWEMRVGSMRIFEKYLKILPDSSISFHLTNKPKLDSFLNRFKIETKNKLSDKKLILTSQLIPDDKLISKLKELIADKNVDYSIYFKDKLVGYYTAVQIENLENLEDLEIGNYTRIELDSDTHYLEYIWDAIPINSNVLQDDSKYYSNYSQPENEYNKGVHYINPNEIYIHESCKIHPNVVIDASDGPVILDEEMKIMANSTIIGPCYIGSKSIVKAGAKIYGGTSIGEVCKIGGEIEGTIIQSYSNKQHDGFLGHSFISEWVNLGADTNTSDLKNTYSEITVIQRDNEVKTGTMFLGLICGDHTKSAINTQFNTGTIAGVCGILVKPGFLPSHIKSFSWGGLHNSPTYKLSKAIEVCEIVMQRRNKVLSEQEKELLAIEYEKVK